MRGELEEKLAAEFPFMRKSKTFGQQMNDGKINDLYSAFGCECGDGWYEVLRGLCSEVTEVFAEAGAEPLIIVDQVKEKYGGLRFYYHLSAQEGMPEGFAKKIDDVVEKWGDSAETVCEECGKPGKLRNDLGWIQTLCDEHYLKVLKGER